MRMKRDERTLNRPSILVQTPCSINFHSSRAILSSIDTVLCCVFEGKKHLSFLSYYVCEVKCASSLAFIASYIKRGRRDEAKRLSAHFLFFICALYLCFLSLLSILALSCPGKNMWTHDHLTREGDLPASSSTHSFCRRKFKSYPSLDYCSVVELYYYHLKDCVHSSRSLTHSWPKCCKNFLCQCFTIKVIKQYLSLK